VFTEHSLTSYSSKARSTVLNVSITCGLHCFRFATYTVAIAVPVCVHINNSLFGLLGNLAPIASGRTMVYVKERLVNIGQLSDEGAFEGSIRVRTTLMLRSVFMHAAHTASVCVHLYGIRLVLRSVFMHAADTANVCVHRCMYACSVEVCCLYI
jgi:hypothetical protein